MTTILLFCSLLCIKFWWNRNRTSFNVFL
jgi:hypothetical protein